MSSISEVSGAMKPSFAGVNSKGKKNETDFASLLTASADEANALESAGGAASGTGGVQEGDGAPESGTAGEDAVAAKDSGKNDITDALSKAVEDALINNAINRTGSSGLTTGLTDGGLESLALAAAATGEMSESMMAAMMLMMMINMAGEGSDTSMLYSAMAALMSNMSAGSGTGSDSESERTINTQVLGWDSVERKTTGKTPGATYDGTVKTAARPTVSGGAAVIPTNAWVPVTPAVVSLEGDRSPEKLRAVLDQFNVETAARYTPYRNGNTYCNIFVWDATSALGCEVPHYVDSVTGEPRTYPDVSGAYELDANGVHDWLVNKGAEYGWKEVSAEEAQAYANGGHPVVAARKKAGGIGHVQMVCPSRDGGYDPARGPAIAQAGSRNTGFAYQSNIYGSAAQAQVRYFVHA